MRIRFYLKVPKAGKFRAFIYGSHRSLGYGEPENGVLMKNNHGIYQFSVEIELEDLNNDLWYSYYLKSDFGGNVYEVVCKRKLENSIVFDTFDRISSIDENVVHFRVRYNTKFGQQLFITGDAEELGGWKLENAVSLFYEFNQDYWEGSVKFQKSVVSRKIKYKYVVVNDNNDYFFEPAKNHVIEISPTLFPLVLEIHDTFRWEDSSLDTLTKSPFVDVITKREMVEDNCLSQIEIKSSILYFSALIPNVRYNQRVKIVGSISELGRWDPRFGIELSDHDFPTWIGRIELINGIKHFEYKYVIIDGLNVIWENGNNRSYDGKTSNIVDIDYPKLIWINDWYVNPNNELIKVFGVYCPLFSLRTKNSQGIGSYTDIIQLVDLCNNIGASMIQLLPINDTLDKGTWNDSYPYRQFSCFALNPIYIDILSITNLPSNIEKEIMINKNKLELLKDIDFPLVYSFKMKMLRKIYNIIDVSKSPKFLKFVNDNNYWIKPYALFCTLRDKYGTSEFRSWNKYSKIKTEEIEQLCNDNIEHVNYYYWIQYICEKQFQKSKKYAVKHRVALKGDLPIGVGYNSVDCWAYPSNFRHDMCCGAPPDSFSDVGQNWEFPTFNWDNMSLNNYEWFKMRLLRFSKLFHAIRLDHVLGFFRVWEITRFTSKTAVLGHYYKCKPIYIDELRENGLYNINRYIKPYIRWHLIQNKFGKEAHDVVNKYFVPQYINSDDDYFDFKEEYNNEIKIKNKLKNEIKDLEKRKQYQNHLFHFIENVCLIPDQEMEDYYHFRTEIKIEHIENTRYGKILFESSSWKELPIWERNKLFELYNDFVYKRHNKIWIEDAEPKLNLIKTTTNMLICSEDLGQFTDEIFKALKSKSFLSLMVQRIPREYSQLFSNVNNFQYLSVSCFSTHDCSTLREWWEEDINLTKNYWKDQLWRNDEFKQTCEPWISEMIIKKNIYVNSILAIFLLQDLTGLLSHLRCENPKDERINIPENNHHHWKFRYKYTLEKLSKDKEFTSKLMEISKGSGRI